MNERQREKLSKLVSTPVKWQCDLARYTSFAIGGPADALVSVKKKNELQSLLTFLATEKLRWRVIGRGTNLLVKDEGFAGVILILDGKFKRVEKLRTEEKETVLVRGGAGCSLTKLVKNCMDWGLTGLEFGYGIPGTLGGAVIMNAGAWGSEIASVVNSVTLTTANGEECFTRPELDFSYRSWNGFRTFLGKAIISEVEMELVEGNPEAIKRYCNELQLRRKKTQPCEYPTAGSFFKNPPNDSAGRLIDASGLKGTTIGGAMISIHHGNFLVNRGGASADDVLQLMKMVQSKVKKDSGVELEPEVHIL